MTVTDWILLVSQLTGTVGAVAAVWVAVVAIRRGNANARAAELALLHERRVNFELSVLRDLGQVNLVPDGTPLAIGHLHLLASMLPIEMIPVARVVAGLETTWEAGELRDKTADRLKDDPHQDWEKYPVWGALQRNIQDELIVAAENLVRDRSRPYSVDTIREPNLGGSLNWPA
ncbi:hypothetical protein RB614_43480 [Phytohabitans sp. ZYX-F-186]|uniref:DUF2489 domain-containing protein n=1 Tax=Phytohabitans maris TaxID=3071409 RepID=A0ABU0ZWF6_9ACTN|nr:hypothetical protein [Phytohabitans sp. ZYX-F-186]MDQ7911371.1 hypothetical protein [Phytohabitans sp. ZYX-F-186]